MAGKSEKGILYLLPTPIADDALYSLSMEVASHTTEVTHYVAENVRTARRFLRALHPHLNIDQLHFSEIDKHNGPDIALLKEWLQKGYNVGLMSEAGCPGIADPGAELVAVAHKVGARVIPLAGPNSLMLALMASGLNGQSFAFNGYLPVKEPARSKRIKELEARSLKENQTQIFIETPYRNDTFLADLLKNCSPKTRICIGQNLTAPDEMIATKTAAEWQKQIPKLGKTPAVFLLLG